MMFRTLAAPQHLTRSYRHVAATAYFSSSTKKRKNSLRGSRGARGHGWFMSYNDPTQKNRHLHGEWFDRDVKSLNSLNEKIFSLKGNDTRVYLDLQVESANENKNKTHRVVIQLAQETLPKTCSNLIALIEDGSLKDTSLYKIEKNVGVHMGDVVLNNGHGGRCHESVSNTGTFEHEAFVLSHSQRGMVTMMNGGNHQNDSRFLITTTDDAPQLDGKFVAFGRVLDNGMDLIQSQIIDQVFTKRGIPTANIKVVDCGLC